MKRGVLTRRRKRVIEAQKWNGRTVCRVGFRFPAIVSCIVSLLLTGPELSSQDRIPISTASNSFPVNFSLGFGYQQGMAFGRFPVFTGSGDCGFFDGGREEARNLSAQLRLPQLLSSTFGFAAGLNIASASEVFTTDPNDPQFINDPLNPSPVELQRKYLFRSSSTTLSLDLLASWKIGSRITLRAGPTFGYRFSGAFEHYDTVLGPDGVVFSDGATRHVMGDAFPFTLRPLTIGGLLGAGVAFPIGKQLRLEPGIALRLDLLGPVQEMRRSTLGAGIGLALTYDLNPARENEDRIEPVNIPLAAESTSARRDPSSEVTSSPPVAESQATDEDSPLGKALNASLDVYSLDQSDLRSDTAVIPMRSVHERRFVSLLQRLYFDRNDAQIPSRYPRLRSGDVAAFSFEALNGSDPERVNDHLLDIVGKRLKDNPGTTVALSGSVSIDEQNGLVEERVESIKRYLRDVWGISGDRIVLAAPASTHDPVDNGTEEGREEQRYVSMEFAPADLAAPVIIEQLAREFSPPGIKLAPRIDSDAVLAKWEIIIRQGSSEVARYTSDVSQETSPGIPWNIVAGDGKAPPATLVAELAAVDRVGREGTARDTLPVVFVSETPGAKGMERLLFVLPGSWGQDVSKKQVEQEAERIAERVRTGERIRIYPRYSGTDRFATERSLALAKALGESVIIQLEARGTHVADVVIEKLPVGSDLSEAYTPERRVAQRGVVVVVERE